MGPNHSNRIIRKILFSNQNKKQLVFALIGVLIGFVFVSISVHYIYEINREDSTSEILNNNAFLIQKKVSNSSALMVSNHVFSDLEKSFYKNQHFIDDVVPVENNNFSVELKSDDPLLPYFRSDIFIQSIPSSFLEVNNFLWSWNEKKDSIVPIILPRDFVYMMNNFLTSSGLPQVSDDLLKDIAFQIKLGDLGREKSFRAKIVGFTNEMNSILVPENFMNYGKNKFGGQVNSNTTQLLMKIQKGKFGMIEDLLKKNHLEIKKNQLIEGKLKSMITIFLSAITLISLVVVFISMIVLIQYLQLLITKNAYEIRTMLRIGVFIRDIVFQYVVYVLIWFVAVFVIVLLIDFLLFKKIDIILHTAGFNVSTFDFKNALIVLISLSLFIIIQSIYSVNRFVRNEF
jgi:hypothetical protein